MALSHIERRRLRGPAGWGSGRAHFKRNVLGREIDGKLKTRRGIDANGVIGVRRDIVDLDDRIASSRTQNPGGQLVLGGVKYGNLHVLKGAQVVYGRDQVHNLTSRGCGGVNA